MSYSSSPCVELGDSPAHWLYRLLCKRANRRSIVQITTEEIGRVLHDSTRKVRENFETLLDMELVCLIAPGVWEVAEKCPHEGKDFVLPGDLFPLSPGEYNAAGIRHEHPSNVYSESRRSTIASSTIGNGGGRVGGHTTKQPPRLTGMYLGNYYFPAQCRRNMPGKLGVHNGRALSGQIASWKRLWGVDGEIVKEMIDLFMQHPEWVGQNKTPWKVFVSRGDQIHKLLEQRKENANDHRTDGEGYWGRSDTMADLQRKLGLVK